MDMTTTFTIEANPTGKFEITCYQPDTGDTIVATADSYDAILVERAAHMAVCEDCQAYGCYTQAVMDAPTHLDVNLSCFNARTMLTVLGLPDSEELCGTADGADFLGRVLLAMATDRDDTGVASVEVGGPGARMIDCGLPAGYYADRFAALHTLATEAVRLGRDITWS